MAQATLRISRHEIADAISAEIVVGSGVLGYVAERLEGYDGVFVAADPGAPSSFLKDVRRLLESSARLLGWAWGSGESVKSIEWVSGLWSMLSESGATRSSALVAVGGGALLDAAGFAASTYMRGIDTVYLPTTSLAMLDAAVGGKTAVNVGGVKNVVGTFHHPRIVAVEVSLLASMPGEVFRQGMAEAVKHAALDSRSRLEWLAASSNAIASRDLDALSALVEWSLSFKMGVVAADYRERRGLRSILNLGHTVAHAIEAASSFKVPHGDAVAMGLVIESLLSVELAGMDPGDARFIEDVLALFGLPTRPDKGLLRKAAGLVSRDKKRVGSTIKMPLLEAIGRPRLLEVEVGFLEKKLESIEEVL